MRSSGEIAWGRAWTSSLAFAFVLWCSSFGFDILIFQIQEPGQMPGYLDVIVASWRRGGLSWLAPYVGWSLVWIGVIAVIIFAVQLPFLLVNAVVDRILAPGFSDLLGTWVRVAARSVVFALIVTLPLFAIVTYEVHYLELGQGWLNSDETGPPLTVEQKWRQTASDAKVLAVQFVVLAALAWVVQAPFALAARARRLRQQATSV